VRSYKRIKRAIETREGGERKCTTVGIIISGGRTSMERYLLDRCVTPIADRSMEAERSGGMAWRTREGKKVAGERRRDEDDPCTVSEPT
jgi:hypothetical protein